MKIKFLGTGAFEGIPGLFCNCDICRKSLELGGKNIRKRASILIDDKVLIDYTNDILSYIHNYKLDFCNLEYLLFTHSHCDHFNYYDLESRVGNIRLQNSKLNIYANNTCINILEKYGESIGSWNEAINLVEIKPYIEYMIGEYTVKPLIANHGIYGEVCLNYIITHNDKTIFYGTDSGLFCDETWEQLENTKLDCIVLDCTYGFSNFKDLSHMGYKQNLEVKKRLLDKGSISEDTKVICTHIAHVANILYDRDFRKLEDMGLTLSYDGMEYEF